jgi:ribosomal protein S12 methylthiotransferase
VKKLLAGKLHIISLGCSKNLIDSEVMGALARDSGMTMANRPQDADVVLVNTCGFIGPAKEESLEAILALAEIKKQRGGAIRLVVAGCLAQRYGRKLLSEIPEADLWIGTGEVGRIAEHLQGLQAGGAKRKAIVSRPDFLMTAHHKRVLPSGAATAYLKISDGCSNRCTYCAIPSIRGRARSRRPEDIVLEAENLVARGVREIILIGQDTTAYGKDLKNRPLLSGLLTDVSAVSGLRRLRLLYAHPAHVTTGVLETMASRENICRYLDLPIQHIDDAILAAMNRRVSSKTIREIIRQARGMMPDLALRTSLIVGFPRETPKRFDRLMDFLRNMRFDHLGVFTYSREEGTPAADLPSRISEKEKERRRDAVMNEQADISLAVNQTLIGSIQEVLIEGKSERRGFALVGRCRRQAPDVDGVTYLKKGRAAAGDFVRCKITGCDHYDLFGEILFDNCRKMKL